MKKSRFSYEEKIAILKEVRAGATVVAACAKHNLWGANIPWVEAQIGGWKWTRRGAYERWRKRTGV